MERTAPNLRAHTTQRIAEVESVTRVKPFERLVAVDSGVAPDPTVLRAYPAADNLTEYRTVGPGGVPVNRQRFTPGEVAELQYQARHMNPRDPFGEHDAARTTQMIRANQAPTADERREQRVQHAAELVEYRDWQDQTVNNVLELLVLTNSNPIYEGTRTDRFTTTTSHRNNTVTHGQRKLFGADRHSRTERFASNYKSIAADRLMPIGELVPDDKDGRTHGWVQFTHEVSEVAGKVPKRTLKGRLTPVPFGAEEITKIGVRFFTGNEAGDPASIQEVSSFNANLLTPNERVLIDTVDSAYGTPNFDQAVNAASAITPSRQSVAGLAEVGAFANLAWQHAVATGVAPNHP